MGVSGEGLLILPPCQPSSIHPGLLYHTKGGGGGGNRTQMLSQGISLEIHAIFQATDLTLPIIIMNIKKLMKLDKLV